MQSILIHEFFPNLLLNTGQYDSLPIRVIPPKNLRPKGVCTPFLLDLHWCRTTRTWTWEYQWSVLLHVCHPEMVVQILTSWRISFLKQMDFIFLCFNEWLPLPPLLFSRRPGLCRLVEATVSRCMLKGFDLRFNVVRIMWTILVIFHGKLGRFEVHMIEVLFLVEQFLNSNYSPSTICQIHLKIVRSMQWGYLYWVIIFEIFLQFSWSKSTYMFPFCWCFSWPLWHKNDASATAHELLD